MVCKNCGEKCFSGEVCKCGEKMPKVNSAGVLINSIICSILLVISIISIVLTMSFRNIVNNNILVDTIKDVDLCSLEVQDESGKTVQLDEYIYNNYIDDDRISVQNVDNVLNDPFIKDFIIEKLEGYQDFCMDKGEMVYITSDDIVNLIDENSDLLFNEAGLQFLEPDKQQLRNDLSVLDDFKDFSDNYNLVYGHHMANGGMFGDVVSFTEKSYFDKHKTGELYLPDKTMHIDLFACMKTSASDSKVYNPQNISKTSESFKSFLDYVREAAICYRDSGRQDTGQIIGLSTCSEAVTNGRVILFGRLSEVTKSNQKQKKAE